MYAIARFWSFTPSNGADAVSPIATAVAKHQKINHLAVNREIIYQRCAHTYVTVVSPTTSGKYPIPKSVRHPEKAPDGPSHHPASHPIQQTDNGQWTQRTDVLRSKRRNNTGEQEARQGDILSENKALVSRFAVRIKHSSRAAANSPLTSTIWAPPRAASVGKSFALLSINPAPTVKKLKVTERVRDDTEVIFLSNE